jgi:hypothetical protein
MNTIAMLSFALAAGLTLAGVSGTIAETLLGGRLSFAEPFMSRRRPVRSFLLAAAAGPLMLAGEALYAWRVGIISFAILIPCGAVAAIWSIASGALFLEVAMKGLAFLR